MLQAKPPADYLRFMKRRNDDVYELLSVNGNRIGWTLYTECEMLDLLKIMELSVEVSTLPLLHHIIWKCIEIREIFGIFGVFSFMSSGYNQFCHLNF